jgi:hypothetical protein
MKKAQAIPWILSAIAIVTLASMIILEPDKVSISGAVVYSAICDKNSYSCIDLDGDGKITLADEDIFAYMLNGTYTQPQYPALFSMADFDLDGDVDQTDFQQCFVPLRDYFKDQKNSEVLCNRPVTNNLTQRTNHTGYTAGCADLNGDGNVNQNDFDLLKNSSVWNKKTNETNYHMADLTGNGIIDIEDQYCMEQFNNNLVMCNLLQNALLAGGKCPDLTDNSGVGNDGRVNDIDRALLNAYMSQQNPKADLNNDGYVTKLDEYIFNQYYGKIVDCNIYHAPWHIGGIDQNNSNTSTTDSTALDNLVSQSFITSREGQLTKIRLYMKYGSGNAGNISVKIYPDDGSGNPNVSVLIPPESTVYSFTNNATHWETAYFNTPPVLSANAKYHIVLNANTSGNTAYAWMRTDNATTGEAHKFNGAIWANLTPATADHVFEAFTTTACADINGDGIVDSDDEAIINSIPDGMTSAGSGAWNSSYDLNNDNKIDSSDAIILSNLISGGDLEKPSRMWNNTGNLTNETFGNVYYLAQSFNASSTKLSKVDLWLASRSNYKRDITVEIRGSVVANNVSMPDSTVLETATITGFINSTLNPYTARFSNTVNLAIGVRYFVVVYSAASPISNAYVWSKANQDPVSYQYSAKSINSGTNWNNESLPYLLTVYQGDARYNESYDFNNDSFMTSDDLMLLNDAIPSYNNAYWTPLVDFNAIFGMYEKTRDKILGFDAYNGKVLKCGLPTYTQSANNRRCEPDIGENYSNSADCAACNYDWFCDSTEDFTNCQDCNKIRGLPKFSKFNTSTTTDFTSVDNISRVSNAVLEIAPYGKMEFLQPVDFTSLDLDSYVNILSNNISIDVSALPQLNKSAKLTLYNLQWAYPGIIVNGNSCPTSICAIVSYSNNNLAFQVSGFNYSPVTSYSSEELAPDTARFNGSTTIFSYSFVSNIENISNMVLEKQGIGKIGFIENINATKANYSRDVDISTSGNGGWAMVNASQDQRLNKSAIITLYNLSLYNPRIVLDNLSQTCAADICRIVSYENNNLIFNVTHFTKYQAIENTTEPQFVNCPVPNFVFNESRNYSLDIAYYFFDADNTTLIYNATVSTPNVAVNIANGTATLSSVGGWSGTGWVNFSASDGDPSHSIASTGQVLFVVQLNLPPQYVNAPIAYSPEQWYENQNATIDLNYYFDDPNYDQLMYNYSFMGIDQDKIAILINQTTEAAKLVPDINWYGQRFVYFKASDGEYEATSDVLLLDVLRVNYAPQQNKTIDSIVINEDANYSLHLPDYFADVEDSSAGLDYEINASPLHPDINAIIANNYLNLSPAANWHGSNDFVIKVTDSDGNYTYSNRFTVYVNSVPDNMTWTGRRFNLTWQEDTVLYVNLSDYFYDPDNNTVYFYRLEHGNNNPNITVSMNYLTGRMALTPKANWFGKEGINLSAQNINSALWNFTNLTVINLDDPVAVTSIPNFNWSEDTTLTINLSNYFSDPDGDEINYTSTKPDNITAVISNATKQANLTPASNFNGIRYIIFTGWTANSANITSNNITLNITPVNDAPVFSLTNQQITVNNTFMYSVAASDTDTGDILSYYDNVTAFEINKTTGQIVWTPPAVQNISVLITVCDNSMAVNNCSSNSFTIGVVPESNSTFISAYVNNTFYQGSYGNVNGIFGSVINISNVTGPVIDVIDSYLFNSRIINSPIHNCDIYNSVLQGTSCTDTFIDPSNINNSNTTGSTIINSGISNSNTTYSRLTNAIIENADVNNSNVSDITLCKLEKTVVRNANITNCTIYTGTILMSNGTVYNTAVSGAANLTSIINYAPNAVINTSSTAGTSSLTVSFDALSSSDPNIPGLLNDMLNYSWDFDNSNGIQADATVNSTNNTYGIGTFTATLTAKDRYDYNDTDTVIITVSAPAAGGGGGGGGGGGRACSSAWQCTAWSTCTNYMQTRKCTDANSCSTATTAKPDESQSCGCFEVWRCNDWQPAECPASGKQTRNCIDLNGCGTIARKPETEVDCAQPVAQQKAQPAPSCYDNIWNQGEAGVDCGGPCAPCPRIEQPAPMPAKDYTWIYIMLGIVLLVGLGVTSFEIVKYYNLHQIRKTATLQENTITQLKDYIRMAFEKGYSREAITEKLMKSGWPKRMVDYAFKRLKDEKLPTAK